MEENYSCTRILRQPWKVGKDSIKIAVKQRTASKARGKVKNIWAKHNFKLIGMQVLWDTVWKGDKAAVFAVIFQGS